ncbi:AAA family ATPase [Clostridium sp. UBA4548]|uniref:AAA family ATPase n=1 Tax=Clostridium sp. UBA4548 TaxID=1946361 RepID=UPI0025B9516A|nr:AAA family ATPase [Clostridium sp. UBA4548]
MRDIKIVGLTGLMGCGKTTICKKINDDEKFKIIRLGEALRKNINNRDMNIKSVEIEAEKLKKCNKSLGEMFIQDINEAAQKGKIIVVDSIRSIQDVNFFRKLTTDFNIIMIIADEEKRLNRILQRERTFDPDGILELRKHDEWEMEFGIKHIFPLTNKYIVNDNIDKSSEEFEVYLKNYKGCDLGGV